MCPCSRPSELAMSAAHPIFKVRLTSFQGPSHVLFSSHLVPTAVSRLIHHVLINNIMTISSTGSARGCENHSVTLGYKTACKTMTACAGLVEFLCTAFKVPQHTYGHVFIYVRLDDINLPYVDDTDRKEVIRGIGSDEVRARWRSPDDAEPSLTGYGFIRIRNPYTYGFFGTYLSSATVTQIICALPTKSNAAKIVDSRLNIELIDSLDT
ncbi:hypothetical protein MSAN_01974000 [Mycena sanguinolenta]|uniref:Uncharacterized protein n=1 Tax=Mycena sanguinolenta TaxID=230812 RepID=A0A8H6XNK1_9AGAR|nr:hypothetical protein MSAN_01974000 [Mycena sanguinolenta]